MGEQAIAVEELIVLTTATQTTTFLAMGEAMEAMDMIAVVL